MSRKLSVYAHRFFPLADAEIRKTMEAMEISMEVMEGLIIHKVTSIEAHCRECKVFIVTLCLSYKLQVTNDIH